MSSNGTQPPGSSGPSPEGDEHRRERREERERTREARRRARGARKERILHTRISERLSEDIRALAEDLRVPVSNLVRNVLEEAFSAVERVSDDVGDLLEDVLDEAERAAERLHRHRARREARGEERDGDLEGDDGGEPAPEAGSLRPGAGAAAPERPAAPEPLDFSAVLAWQPVILNAPQRCARTGRFIPAGEEAFLGTSAGGFSGHFLSREGLDALRTARG
jgi:hypothetical protein